MAIKPILFNTKMVRAILDGRKTVSRRVVNHNHLRGLENLSAEKIKRACVAPYRPGDILYVRETWFYERHMEDLQEEKPDLPSGRYSARYIYRADNPDYPVDVGVYAGGWRPSIFMPREAARIWLRVTDVCVERLQEISAEDVLREGVSASLQRDLQSKQFGAFWDSTIKPADLAIYCWAANPWVWRIEFERCEKPKGAGDV